MKKSIFILMGFILSFFIFSCDVVLPDEESEPTLKGKAIVEFNADPSGDSVKIFINRDTNCNADSDIIKSSTSSTWTYISDSGGGYHKYSASFKITGYKGTYNFCGIVTSSNAKNSNFESLVTIEEGTTQNADFTVGGGGEEEG